MRPFGRLLIANRGEIVVRVARTARAMGLQTVAIHSTADAGALFTRACDTAVDIGGDTPGTSYLVIEKILDAARRSGAQAIHPGYGFLSENAAFAQAVLDADLVWIGPPPAAIAAMADKAAARRAMAKAGAPILPGYDGEDQTLKTLKAEAKKLGAPLMIKARAGGGGRGIRLVEDLAQIDAALESAVREAESAFGDGRVLLERALLSPRHVEVQVLADGHGHVIHLGERDCSLQRRRQKVIEEAPAPGLDPETRAKLGETAVAIAKAVSYAGAGTVEFLFDGRGFYFMEMNTRLQVEHPVTEAITGIDLVAQQLRIAMGERLSLTQEDIRFTGWAVEARLCAEDPAADFSPAAGRVAHWAPPQGVRVDAAIETGAFIPPFYDSMIAKIIAHGATREAAFARLAAALDETRLLGVRSNRAFLARLVRDKEVLAGAVETGLIARTPALRAERAADWAWALAAAISTHGEAHGFCAAPEWMGFHNGQALPQRWRLALHGEERSGVVQGARVTMGEAAHVVSTNRWVEGEVLTFTVNEALHAALYRWEGSQLHLSLGEAGDFTFQQLRRTSKVSADAKARAGALTAGMNGRVVRIEAAVGDAVKAGDALVVLEAMKMEHVLAAPAAGQVKAVHAGVGDQVAPGHLLMELTPLDAEAKHG
jgi:geranyl-CoA carboxylase alpha subunit